MRRLLGEGGDDGDPLVFDDEYLSSAGQLYELAVGHDRWTADLRPLLQPARRAAGRAPIFCAHPYDLSCELIAREAGVIVTDPRGAPLAAAAGRDRRRRLDRFRERRAGAFGRRRADGGASRARR